MSQIGTMVSAYLVTYNLRIFKKSLLFRVCCRKIPYSFRQFQPVKKGMVIPICRITANPPDLEQAAMHCLVKQPYGNLIFCGKYFFFQNMVFFVPLRKIFPEPFLRKIKFIIHKAVPVVPRKSKEYAGLAVFRFAQAAAVLTLHPSGMFLFFHKTYHLRTVYQGPVQPVWKAVPGKYPGGAVHQKGIVKKTAAWGGHTSPRKNGVQLVRWSYVPAGLTAPL